MVLMGLGLGFNFQPVILAVQNAVGPRDMGVATSSVTFFRQMGGTLGVAVFLSILFGVLGHHAGDQVNPVAPTAAYQQGLASMSADDKAKLAPGGSLTDDTSFISRIPDAVSSPI